LSAAFCSSLASFHLVPQSLSFFVNDQICLLFRPEISYPYVNSQQE
jgi:hypothetical protein